MIDNYLVPLISRSARLAVFHSHVTASQILLSLLQIISRPCHILIIIQRRAVAFRIEVDKDTFQLGRHLSTWGFDVFQTQSPPSSGLDLL